MHAVSWDITLMTMLHADRNCSCARCMACHHARGYSLKQRGVRHCSQRGHHKVCTPVPMRWKRPPSTQSQLPNKRLCLQGPARLSSGLLRSPHQPPTPPAPKHRSSALSPLRMAWQTKGHGRNSHAYPGGRGVQTLEHTGTEKT